MGGCTDCTRLGGCSTRKGEERELLSAILPHLYPSRRWGEPDDLARHHGGANEQEGRSLARQAAELLQARTYFQPGGEEELCEHIYVLCVGREPGLFELRDREVIELPDLPEGGRISERYLRASLSQVARVATVQEVSFELERSGDLYVITEAPRAGVYDPILLKRTQKLIELLVEANLTYLDFGLIAKPPEEFDAGGYEEQYGQPAGIVNYLFYPQPPTAVGTCYVPARMA